MSPYDEIKERLYHCHQELPRRGLVLYSFGNVSAIDRHRGIVAVKASGVPYDTMTADDMVIVDLNGRVLEGDRNPSTDTRTHLVLYNHFSGIGGIVHTHSTYAVAWAQAARPIPLLGTTHADHLPCDVPCTEFMPDMDLHGDFETGTGQHIVNVLPGSSYQEIEMVLVAGHGPFTWGATPEKAVYNSVMLEELAKMAFLTLQIEPGTPRLQETLINKHYRRKHGRDAYYGQ